jgi:hypothetical protein
MKRREIKFVAGSLQLAPGRIEAAPTLRKGAAGPAKRQKPAQAQIRRPATAKAARKSR